MSTQKLIEGLQGWQEHYSDPADKNNYDFFTALIAAVDRLEAAERERDELKQRLANSEHQLHMAELAKFNLRNQRRAQFSKRREAEAEIARRDAAAGEPVAWQYRYNDGGGIGDWYTVASESECNHLPCFERRAIYTAAQPAVLPELEQDVKNIIGLLSGNEWAEHCTKSALGRKLENEITELHNTYSRAHAVLPPDITFESKGFLSLTSEDFAYNRALEDVRKLGAQPQKVVELKADWVVRKGKEPCAQAFCNGYALRAYEDKAALDAAGIKWEVKK